MLARTVDLKGESRDRFTALYKSLIDELQPVTAIEELLVQKMAVAQWRQIRIWSFEKNSMDSTTPNLQAHGDRASIYETRYDRQFDRAMATLERRRAKKMRSEPSK